MFENPRRSRQARSFTTNVPKILDLKSSSEAIFFRKLSLSAPEGLICPNNMKIVILRLMTEIPALNFIITVKGGRKILDYKRISDWCKKRNDFSHFEIPRAPFEFPLVLILSPSMLSRLFLLSAFLRTRGTLSLATRANCILRTWNWAVGTSFLSPMQSESQSMDTRTTVSPTVVDFKDSIPL